jgi:hypothetical protein
MNIYMNMIYIYIYMNIYMYIWTLRYEDLLLTRVNRIADALDIGFKSTIEFFKKQCMDIAAELLAGKPEKEARFLAMIVNKLGTYRIKNLVDIYRSMYVYVSIYVYICCCMYRLTNMRGLEI